MPESKVPETLNDLIRTLERSQDLRSLARECGLSVRELRKRLARWRREMGTSQTAKSAVEPVKPAKSAKSGPGGVAGFPDLPAAAGIGECPLPDKGSPVLEIFTDGASRGNPGPSSIGVLFRQKGGPDLCSHRETIGRATNNEAEYRAVVAALEHCERWGVARVHLFLDSELVARQLMGSYRVKSLALRPFYQQAVHVSRGLKEFRVRHIPRAKNAFADHLANLALDEKG